MSACPQCGAVPRPNDKFCNTCGLPVAQPAPPAQNAQGYGPPPAPPQGYGTPPQPPQQAWGAPATAVCQMGHEISPGAGYCAMGHPAADAGAFGGAQYGAQGGYGAPQPAGGGYPGQQGYGGSPQGAGYGQPQGYASGGGFPSAQQGYAAPPPPPPPPPPGYAPPPAGTADPAGSGASPAAIGARVLRGFLVSYQSNAAGEFWPLNVGRITIGRSNSGETLDVPLADATISSRHAAISVDAASGSIQVEDTGSTNGTFVNDEHLGFNGRRELRDGDRVRFGGFTTTVKVIART